MEIGRKATDQRNPCRKFLATPVMTPETLKSARFKSELLGQGSGATVSQEQKQSPHHKGGWQKCVVLWKTNFTSLQSNHLMRPRPQHHLLEMVFVDATDRWQQLLWPQCLPVQFVDPTSPTLTVTLLPTPQRFVGPVRNSQLETALC